MREAKLAMKKRIFWTAFALIILSWNILSSCESPFVAGLGAKVDINPPTIAMVTPEPAAFIKGTKYPFRIFAQDDVDVFRVEIAFNVVPNVEPSQWHPATQDSVNDQYWDFFLDTTNILPKEGEEEGDGTLTVRLRAIDGSGKTTYSDDIAYTVHNNPPKVTLSSLEPSITISNYASIYAQGILPTQLTNQPLLGTVSDIHGIAPGYPKIKFWPADKDEPDPTNVSDRYPAFNRVDFPEYNLWNETTVWETTWPIGRRDVNFRYWMSVRRDDGSLEEKAQQLPVGKYRYRIKVRDVDGGERIFPDTGQTGGLVELITSGSIPTVTVLDPTEMVQVPKYTIRVQAYDAINIDRTNILVKDSDNNMKALKWDRRTYEPVAPSGNNPGGSGYIYELDVFPGRIVNFVNENAPQAQNPAARDESGDLFQTTTGATYTGKFTFADNKQYTFITETWSTSGVYNSSSAGLILDAVSPRFENITIDRASQVTVYESNGPYDYVDWPGAAQRPWTQASRTSLSPNPLPYLTTFVNGNAVTVSVTVIEPWGLGVDGSHQSLKWVVVPATSRWSAFDQTSLAARYNAIPNNIPANFVDATDNTLTWDSTSYGLTQTDTVYLYIVGRDKAGNYGYTERELLVDQRTDMPVFSLSGLNRTINDAGKLIASSGEPTENVSSNINFQIRLEDNNGSIKNAKLTVNGPGSKTYAQNVSTDSSPKTITVNEDLLTSSIPGVPEGLYNFELEFSDTKGNTTKSGKVFFAKDTLPPRIGDLKINSQRIDDWIPRPASNIVRIEGTIKEESGLGYLRSFKIQIAATGVNPDFSTALDIIEVYDASSNKIERNPANPSYGNTDTGTWYYDYSLSPTDPPDQTIYVQAVDRFGRSATVTVPVQIDSGKPRVLFDPVTPNPIGAQSWYKTSSAVLSVMVRDYRAEVDPNGTTVRGSGVEQFLYWIGKQGDGPSFNAFPDYAAQNWSLTAPAPYTNTGSDYIGAYTAASWKSEFARPAVSLDIPLSSISQGKKVIHGLAFDKVGLISDHTTNTTSDYKTLSTFAFIYDYEAPVLTGFAPNSHSSQGGTADAPIYYRNGGTAYNSGFNLAGTVTDEGGLTWVTVEQWKETGDGSSPAISPMWVKIYDSAQSANSLSLTGLAELEKLPRNPTNPSDHTDSYFTASHDSDGTYHYRLTAKDITAGLAGELTTVKTITVVVDRDPPNISLSGIADHAAVSELYLNLTGTVSDPGNISSVTNIRYQISSAAAAPVAGDSSYNKRLQNPDPSWNLSENISTLVDGRELYFHYYAEDAAGNNTTPLSIHFYVDKGDPTVSGFKPNASSANSGTTYYRNGNSSYNTAFSLGGTVGDTVGLKNVKVEQMKVSGPDVTGIPVWQDITPASPVYTWSLTASLSTNTKTFTLSGLTDLPRDPSNHTDTTAAAAYFAATNTVLVGGVNVYKADGTYRYRLTAEDHARHTFTTEITVVVDRQGPKVTLTPLTDPWMENGNASAFNIEGKVEDPGNISTVKEIRYVVNTSSTAPATLNSTSYPGDITNPAENWIKRNVTIPNQGKNYIHYYAVDNAGNFSASDTKMFFYDNGLPTASNFKPNASSANSGTTYYRNGNSPYNTAFSLGGTVGDTVGLKSVTVKQMKVSGPGVTGTPDWATDGKDITPASGYTWTLDTTPSTASGTTSFTLSGLTDLPRDPSNHTDTTAAAAYFAATNTVSVGSVNVYKADGTYKYQITVWDHAEHHIEMEITVVVDRQSPEVEITPPATPWMESSARSLNLMGKVKDPGDISRVTAIRYMISDTVSTAPAAADPGYTGTINSPGEDWNARNIAIPATPLTGQFYIHYYAVDSAGNTGAPVTVTFFYDNLAPTVTGFEPDTNSSTGGTTANPIYYRNGTSNGTLQFHLKGSVDDTVSIKTVTVEQWKQSGGTNFSEAEDWKTIYDSGSTLATVPPFDRSLNIASPTHLAASLPRDPTNPSNLLAAGTYWNAVTGGANNADGTYQYRINAVDHAGNRIVKEITVVVDRQAPVPIVDNPDSVRTSNLNLTGKVSDPGEVSKVTEIRYVVDTNSTAPTVLNSTNYPQVINNPGTPWYKTETLSGSDGPRYIHYYAVDSAGNISAVKTEQFTYDKTPPKFIWGKSTNLEPAFTNTDPVNGTGGADPDPKPAATLYAGGPGFSGFSFTFIGDDALLLDSDRTDVVYPFTVTRVKAGGATVDLPFTAAGQGTFHRGAAPKVERAEYTITEASTLPEGEYTYTITLQDHAGNTAPPVSLKVVVDTTGPTLTITQPAIISPATEGYVDSATPTVSGTAADVSPIAKIFFVITNRGDTVTPPAFDGTGGSTGWKEAAPGNNWFYSVTAADSLTQGEKTLHVAAYDNAKNQSAVVTRDFVADFGPPTFAWVGSTVLNLDPLSTGIPANPNINSGILPSTTPTAYINGSSGGSFTFTFNASDGYLLHKTIPYTITRSKNGAAAVTIAAGKVSPAVSTPATNVDFTVTQTLGTNNTFDIDEDGEYLYTITVRDDSGQTAAARLQVIVDRKAPSMDINSFNRLVDTSTRTDLSSDERRNGSINGWVEFIIAAQDESGISEVKYWFVPGTGTNGDTAPAGAAIPTWASSAAGTYGDPQGTFANMPYKNAWNTTANTVTDKTSYYFYAAARDKAGNIAWLNGGTSGFNTLYHKLFVNQATDKPVLEATYPPPGGFINSLSFNVTGRIRDDDGIKVQASGSLKYFGPQSAALTAANVPNQDISLGNSGANLADLTFSKALTVTSDGTYNLRLEAFDTADTPPKVHENTANSGTANSISSSYYDISFTVDQTKPVITVTSPLDQTGIKDGGSFIMSGNLVEQYFQMASYPFGVSAGTLTVSLDGGPDEDISTYITSTQRFDQSNTPKTWAGVSLETLFVNSTRYPSYSGFANLSDGSHTITFKARDMAGNEAEAVQHTFYKDTTAPEIKFSNIKRVQITKADIEHTDPNVYANKRKDVTSITDPNPVIRGSFSDTYSRIGSAQDSLSSPANQYYFEYRIYDKEHIKTNAVTGMPWQKGYLGADPENNTDWSIDLRDLPYDLRLLVGAGSQELPDGLYWLDIRVADRAGNDTPSSIPAANPTRFFGQDLSIAFVVDRFSPEIKTTEANGKAYSMPTGGATTAVTNGGTAKDANLAWVTITGPLELVPGNPPTINEITVDLTVAGSTNAYIVSSITSVSTFNPQLITQGWKFEITKALFEAMTDGEKTFTFKAADTTTPPHITEQTWTFYKDTTGPNVDLFNLKWVNNDPANPNAFQESSPKIMGSAKDDRGIYSVYTRIQRYDVSNSTSKWVNFDDRSGAAHQTSAVAAFIKLAQAANYDSSSSLGGQYNWEKNLGPSPGAALPEGRYRIAFLTEDMARNISINNTYTVSSWDETNDAHWVTFVIDRTPPTLELDPAPSFPIYTNAKETDAINPAEHYRVSGRAYDGNGIEVNGPLSKVTAKLTKGSTQIGSVYQATGSFRAPGTTDDFYNTYWNIDIPWSDLDAGGEGVYTLSVEATDLSGKTAMKSRDFTFDKTPPTGKVTSPGPTDAVRGLRVMQAEASDFYGVAKVEYLRGYTDRTAQNWVSAGLAQGETPHNNTSLNFRFEGGLYTWRVNFDNIASKLMCGDNGSFAGDGSGQRVIWNSTSYVPEVNTANPWSNIWRVPFDFRITDVAGNQKIVQYELILDPDGDIPTAAIQRPASNQVVGGEVQIGGLAQDDNAVWIVLVRTFKGTVDLNALGGIENQINLNKIVRYPINTTPSGQDTRKTNADGWALAKLANTGAMVNWNFAVNSFGELNTEGVQQDVYVQVMVYDTKHNTAVPTDISTICDSAGHLLNWAIDDRRPSTTHYGVAFKIDSTVPSIEHPVLERSNDSVLFEANRYRAAGKITFHNVLVDDGGIKNAKFTLPGYSINSAGDYIMRDGAIVSYSNPNVAVQMYMPSPLVDASALQTGDKYIIRDVGTTNWTALGAPRNEPGLAFTATGNGSGDGKAYWVETGGIPNVRTSSSNLVMGRKYMVAYVGGANFISVGAASNEVGATFMATGTSAGAGGTVYEAVGPLGNDAGQKFHYPVALTLDTRNRFPVTGTPSNPSSGNMLLDFQVEDNTQPFAYQTQQSYSIQVDNFYPYGIYRAQRNASTAAYWVLGRSQDIDASKHSGSIEGIARVLVYFRRGSTYYNPQGSAFAPVSAKNVKDTTQTGAPVVENFNYWPNVNKPFPNTDAVVIDTNEQNKDTNGNGYIEMFRNSGPWKEWGFQFDTKKFTDGPLYVNYIIIDTAGNATRYEDQIYINNNPPLINKITLSTDYDFNHIPGSIPTESKEIALDPLGSRLGYQSTGFKVRNARLKFDVYLNTGSGNGDKTLRVSPVDQGTLVQSTALVAGTIYTIADPGNVEWELVGARSNDVGTAFIATGPADDLTPESLLNGAAYTWAAHNGASPITAAIAAGDDDGNVTFGLNTTWTSPPTDDHFGTASGKIQDSAAGQSNDRAFLVKVYDNTIPGDPEENQLADVVLVKLTINNEDAEKPKGFVDPFYWNSADDNSLYGNSRDNGHIELEGDLPAAFNQPSGVKDKDPKVSGQISIRGSLTDNNVIESIWVKMDNFPFTGGVTANPPRTGFVQAAQFNPKTRQFQGVDQWNANGWKMSAETVSLNENGHTVKWQLDIDTLKRPAAFVTALDQAFEVAVKDFYANASDESTTQTNSATKTPYYRMDIVPYISSVSTTVRTQGGLKANNIRSADGIYSVIQGSNDSFITVTGFNLKPYANTGAVTILSAAQNGNYNPGAAATGTALVYSAAAAPWTSLTVSNNSAKSGYLTIYAGTSALPIGTLNNINNNNALGARPLVLSKNASSQYELKPGVSNGSDEENMPNREADRYLTRNITLTDDRYLQFYTVKKTNVVNGYYPVMLMEGNDPVFAYLDTRGGPYGNPGHAATDGAGSYQSTDAWPQRAQFDWSAATPVTPKYIEFLAKAASAMDQMGMAQDASGRYTHMTVYNHNYGGIDFFYDRYAELWSSTNFNNGAALMAGMPYVNFKGDKTVYKRNTAISLEKTSQGSYGTPQLDRFWYPKLIAKGDSSGSGYSKNYLLYYDGYGDGSISELLFRTFQIGAKSGTRTQPLDPWTDSGLQDTDAPNSSERWLGISSSTAKDYTPTIESDKTWWTDRKGVSLLTRFTNAIENTFDYTNTPTQFASGRNVAATNASKHFDMGVTTDDRVVIVYYDESDGRMKLKYSTNPGIDGSNISGITFADSPLVLPDYVGMYVSMKLDSGNGIHIAAFDASDSVLKYIYIPSYNAASFKAVTVDQYGSVGNWTDIRLHPTSNTPYIGYYNATETGGRESIKIAWAKTPVSGVNDVKDGVDNSGYTTGNWEYRTVPTLDPPQGGSPKFQKVNLGFMTAAEGYRPVLGYLGTNIEFSYPVKE